MSETIDPTESESESESESAYSIHSVNDGRADEWNAEFVRVMKESEFDRSEPGQEFFRPFTTHYSAQFASAPLGMSHPDLLKWMGLRASQNREK